MKNTSLIISSSRLTEVENMILETLEAHGLQLGTDFHLRTEEAGTVQQLEKPKSEDQFYFDELTRLNNEFIKAQRELAKANAGLKEMVELRNRFVGMAAHDLRNPISIIRSFSEILKNDADLSTDNQEITAIMHRTAIFMQKLVDSILDLSAMQSGKVSLNLAEVEINQLFERMIVQNQILANQHGISIIYDGLDQEVKSSIDSVKIGQVVNNLINNSIKYSPDNSTITCTARIRDNACLFCVQDEGPGIAKEDAIKIFEPFQRLSNNEGRQKSVGLGLSICKNIIEAHGGKIWVNSVEGKGADFCFSIPLS